MNRKIILFGGTFDPVHVGHMKVAEDAAEHIGGDEVVFVVAKRSPHKDVFPVAEGSDRIAMVELAIGGKENWRVSDCEFERKDPSYTLDTVLGLREAYGVGCEFYWLVGADMVKDLPDWHEVGKLLEVCTVCVMQRGGVGKPDFSGFAKLGRERVEKLEKDVIFTRLIDVSSTEIRAKLGRGEDMGGLLCGSVLDYIEKNGLYS